MPRIPNTRPTSIYWLYDMRPESLVDWPEGLPFYCGKTVASVRFRMNEHRRDAKRDAHRPVSSWMTACGKNVRVHTVELVPADKDWRTREQFWISMIRLVYPQGANVSNGGEGAPGYIHTVESRIKMSVARKGKKLSEGHRINLAAAQIGRKLSSEHRAKISARRKGVPTTTGRKHSPETRAKIAATKIGKKQSPEQIAQRVAKNTGKKRSPEARARMKAAQVASRLRMAAA